MENYKERELFKWLEVPDNKAYAELIWICRMRTIVNDDAFSTVQGADLDTFMGYMMDDNYYGFQQVKMLKARRKRLKGGSK